MISSNIYKKYSYKKFYFGIKIESFWKTSLQYSPVGHFPYLWRRLRTLDILREEAASSEKSQTEIPLGGSITPSAVSLCTGEGLGIFLTGDF